MSRAWIVAALVGACFFGGAAQAKDEDPSVRYALSRFLEAAREADWAEARAAWSELESLEAAPPRLACLAAEVEFQSGELESARRLLDPLLRAERPRIDALYLSARLAINTGEVEEAKRCLLAAASGGQAVLHDVGGDAALAPLLRDPEFAIRVLEANRSAELPRTWRNPFARSQRSPAPQPKVRTFSLARLRLALKRARERAAARDLEGLDEALRALRREVEVAERAERGSAEAIYAEARSEIDRLGALAGTIRLQLFVGRGNQLLQALSERATASDLPGARAVRGEILTLCKRFEGRDEQIYRLTSARLRTRAEAIWTELEIRHEVAALKLPVAGIVIPPPEEGSPSRAIVSGLIVSVGEAIGPEGETTSPTDPKAVLVKRIQVGAVTFSYRGVLFVRRPQALH